MTKLQDTMTMDEKTVQRLASNEIRLPRRRRAKRDDDKSSPVVIKRKGDHAAEKLFHGVNNDVYDKAIDLADKNWRRLEVVDSETVIVHNNEVH